MMDPREDINKPIVLITGCSEGGIGHALARAFAANKCAVVATSRSRSTMADLEHDTRFFLQELDVKSDDSVRRALDAVIAHFGRVDVLVNNAGVQCVGPLPEYRKPWGTDAWGAGNDLKISTVCVGLIKFLCHWGHAGALRMIQAVVPHMAKRKQGKIVNVGSVTAMASGPWSGAYTSSKAALHSLTDTLRLELSHFGIDVVNVVPGAIKSNIGNSAIASYDHMPEWDLFKPFEAAIRDRAYFSQKTKSTPNDEFAKHTVAAILKKKPPAWFSYGHYSTAMAIMYHLPLCVRDFILKKAMKC
ncbi:hypothetical protein Ahy_A10g050149 isoform B [Arachis hypogaea]|uniref:NADPH-dependent 1-acyldihydroxyacetone phosphate reductase n=1 Tax=Arachis hypogaea TaxID=3818 RepID=A0A445B8Q0_ARAHY|nr:hypothetical protein Ahy_A10g050149 isoform B [Arachis hypogaea]